jgi:ribosomal protein S18 acetylase RimI-like enzyme
VSRHLCLHAKEDLESFYRRDAALHLYEIGDLDEFYWAHTTWYGAKDAGELVEVALLYSGLALPTLLALSRQPDRMRQLLDSIRPLLPVTFYAHLTGDSVAAFVREDGVTPHGTHLKMALQRPEYLDRGGPGADGATVTAAAVEALGPEDLPDLVAFYRAAYPGNWFEARMLETGAYFGLRRGGKLVSVAGVHVLSLLYKVAALGNIATLPENRGQGLAGAVTAALCRSLLPRVEQIGLNVRADNHGAIACYERLGFAPVGEYGEYTIRLRSD